MALRKVNTITTIRKTTRSAYRLIEVAINGIHIMWVEEDSDADFEATYEEYHGFAYAALHRTRDRHFGENLVHDRVRELVALSCVYIGTNNG